jgi:aminobenzoyl-glutamate utilization protein B
MTLLDVLLQPDVVQQAWDYFRNVQTKDRKYTRFITEKDPPATWLNRATVEKYRPEMTKYYYDPTKYKTYLEQLGIRYPTVRTGTPSQRAGR